MKRGWQWGKPHFLYVDGEWQIVYKNSLYINRVNPSVRGMWEYFLWATTGKQMS